MKHFFSLTLHLYFLLPSLILSFPTLPFTSLSVSFFGQFWSAVAQPLCAGSAAPWIVAAAFSPASSSLAPCVILQMRYSSTTWPRSCYFSVPVPPVASHHTESWILKCVCDLSLKWQGRAYIDDPGDSWSGCSLTSICLTQAKERSAERRICGHLGAHSFHTQAFRISVVSSATVTYLLLLLYFMPWLQCCLELSR